jgi:hypothetical protein
MPIFPEASSTVATSPFRVSWAQTVLAKLNAKIADIKMRAGLIIASYG